MMNTGQLKQKLDELEISAEAYSLDGTPSPDRMILLRDFREWIVLYVDPQGEKSNVKTFASESEACSYLYNYYRLR
jgi:hypothetical protein